MTNGAQFIQTLILKCNDKQQEKVHYRSKEVILKMKKKEVFIMIQH